MRVARFAKPAPLSTRAILYTPLAQPKSLRSPAHWAHLVFCLLWALLLTFRTVGANAQDSIHAPEYTSIVVFGDSLSDTGNLAHLTEAKYGVRIPGPSADYTDGRATDGYDTLPAA